VEVSFPFHRSSFDLGLLTTLNPSGNYMYHQL
jgi:hypothetical protein